MKNSKPLPPFGYFFLLFLSLFACTPNTSPEKIGEKFYELQRKRDFPQVLQLCSQQAFEDNSKKEWMELFENKFAQTGDLVMYRKLSQESGLQDSFKVIALNYEVKYKELVLYERVVLLKEKADYKVVGYKFDPNKIQ
jgi:hypothetical protein